MFNIQRKTFDKKILSWKGLTKVFFRKPKSQFKPSFFLFPPPSIDIKAPVF